MLPRADSRVFFRSLSLSLSLFLSLCLSFSFSISDSRNGAASISINTSAAIDSGVPLLAAVEIPSKNIASSFSPILAVYISGVARGWGRAGRRGEEGERIGGTVELTYDGDGVLISDGRENCD